MNLMDILAGAGNLLDLPGSMIRDLLSGRNPTDQWATPFSGDNRASGRDVLEPFLGANEETGMSGWLDNPMEGLKDIAGFGAEMLLDPTNLIPAGAMAKLLRARKSAKQANAAAKAARGGRYSMVNAKLSNEVIPAAQNPMKRLGYSPPPLKTLPYEKIANLPEPHSAAVWNEKNATLTGYNHGGEIPHQNTYLVKSTHYPSADRTYRSMYPGSEIGDGTTMPNLNAYSGMSPGHAAARAAMDQSRDTLGRVDVLRQMPNPPETDFAGGYAPSKLWNQTSDMHSGPHPILPDTDIWNQLASMEQSRSKGKMQAGYSGPFQTPDNLVSNMDSLSIANVPSVHRQAAAAIIYNMIARNNRSGVDPASQSPFVAGRQ